LWFEGYSEFGSFLGTHSYASFRSYRHEVDASFWYFGFNRGPKYTNQSASYNGPKKLTSLASSWISSLCSSCSLCYSSYCFSSNVLLLFLLLFLDRLLPFFVPLLPFFVPLLLFLLPFPLFLPDFFFFFFEDFELLLDLLFFPFFFRFLLPLLPFFFFFLSLGLKNISIFRSYSQLQFYTRFWFFFGNFETLFRRFLRRSLGQSLPKVEQNVDSAFALVQDTDRFDSRFAHHDRPQIDEFVSLVHKCQFEGHSFAQNVHVRFFTIHVQWKLQIVLSYDERGGNKS
jgi:hypothetical protein